MNLKRMYSTVICSMTVLLIITTTLFWRFNSLADRSRNLNQDGIRLITYGNEMLHLNDYLVKLMRAFSLNHEKTDILDEYYSLLTYDNLEGKLDKMAEIGLTEEESALTADLYVLLSNLAEIESRAIDAHMAGDCESAVSIIFSEEYINIDFQLSKKTGALVTSITDRVNTGVHRIQEQLIAMQYFVSIFLTLSILSLIILQIIQRNRVLRPVVEIENVMTSISKGDLTSRLIKKHNDEMGSLFGHINSMADSIETYMKESDKSLSILKNILNGMDSFIYVTDLDTDIILFINEPMKRHFNIKDDGVGNYCYKILQDGVDSRCDFCPCYQIDKDHDKIVVWEKYNPVTNRIYQNTDCYIDWIGGVKAHLQHSVDITDIKQAMDGMIAAEHEALEMRHEKEKAEVAAKAKSDFLAKMSHEIRTPMNAVMGMSEIILRKNLPQDVYENALGIKNASINLLSIINDILDFSKIESGMMEIVETNYLLPSLINDVISIIRIRLIDKPIHFAVNIDPNIPSHLIGDEVRVRQILINLLSNAVKYTDEGFIIMTVTGETEDGMVTLHVDIKDSGIGIKEEDIGKLFGDFVQIDAIKNKDIVGTGLGLAITRNLARLMGGDVTLRSEYGKGSTFSAALPQRFDEYVPFVSKDRLEGKSILIYETRQIYRDSIVAALESLGVEYKSVESIPELFDNLEKFNYVFISSFMYGSMNPVMSKFQNPHSSLVLLSDVTESIAPRDATILALPAYSLSIANTLEGHCETYSSSRMIGASFTAPEAKVLIVDDVAANLKVCEGLLIPYEMQVTLCKGGYEAVELITNNTYDLVFMDHMMPEIDGLEATRLIREMDGDYFQNLPIIALTANAVSGVREMFVQNGMSDFLSKPIETAKLDTILDKWISDDKKQKAAVRDSEEETAFVSSLRSVHELSVDTALSVVGGSYQTYERMVKLSVRLLPENIARLDELISSDLPNYSIEVHGIKGVLNNIGAYELGEIAYKLEELSKQGSLDACKELHPHLIEKLSNFSYVMKNLLDKDEASDKEDGELSVIFASLPELEDAADFCDNEAAIKILSSIRQYTYGQIADNLLAELTLAFERFDFEESTELLTKLRGELLECVR